MTNSECLLTPTLQSGILFFVTFFVTWGKKFSFLLLLKKNAWLQVNHCTWLMGKPYSYLYLLLPHTHCLSAVHIFCFFTLTHPSPFVGLKDKPRCWIISLITYIWRFCYLFWVAKIHNNFKSNQHNQMLYTVQIRITNSWLEKHQV